MSPEAQFKARLRAGEPLIGTFVKTPSPVIVEVLARSGLDCICLDAEHGPFDRAAIDLCLLAARANGLPALVRTPSAEGHHILNALDLGAAGIVVPHVRSGAEAAAIAKSAHYGAGGRGYAGGTRASGYAAPPIGERLARTRDETSVIVQLEDADALPEAAAIASAPGVDAVFIGRIDLTVALGEVDAKAPAVMAAVEAATATIRAAGAAVGMFTPDLGEVAQWRAAGASLFLLGSDLGFVRAGAEGLRRSVRF